MHTNRKVIILASSVLEMPGYFQAGDFSSGESKCFIRKEGYPTMKISMMDIRTITLNEDGTIKDMIVLNRDEEPTVPLPP